jgi:hypothetical protein
MLRDFAFAHHGEIGAEPREVIDLVVGVGAGDDFQRRVGPPLLAQVQDIPRVCGNPNESLAKA